MQPDISLERSDVAERFSEYAIGIMLLLKGWEDVPHFRHFPYRVIFIFLAGLFIIAGTKFQNQLAERAKSLPGIFHLLEGLVEIIVASMLLEEGKHWRPLFLALAGLYFCGLGLVHLLAKEGKREKAFRCLRIIQGITFIIFSITVAVANALSDPRAEVLVSAALLAFFGIILLVKRVTHQRKRVGLAFRVYEYLRQKRAAKRSK